MRAITEMTLDSKKRAQILRSIKKLVLAHHINVGGIDYSAWTERVDERTPELLTAELAAFEAGIRQLLAELKTSHTVFYYSLPKELLPQHTINASLRDVPLNGARKWMFLDVFEDGPAHIAGIRPRGFPGRRGRHNLPAARDTIFCDRPYSHVGCSRPRQRESKGDCD